MDVKRLQDAYYKPNLTPKAAASILNALQGVHLTTEQELRMKEIHADVRKRFGRALQKIPR